MAVPKKNHSHQRQQKEELTGKVSFKMSLIVKIVVKNT